MERVSEACVRALAAACPAGSLSGTDFFGGRCGGSAAAAMNFAWIGSRGKFWTVADWALYYSILGSRGIHPGAPKARQITAELQRNPGVVVTAADLKSHTPYNNCHVQRLSKEGRQEQTTRMDPQTGKTVDGVFLVPYVHQNAMAPEYVDGRYTLEQLAIGYGALLLNVWQTLDTPAKPPGGTSTGKKATARRTRKATGSKATGSKATGSKATGSKATGSKATGAKATGKK